MTDLKPCAWCDCMPNEPNAGGMVYHEPSNCMLGNSSWFVDDWNTRADRPAGGVDLSVVQRWDIDPDGGASYPLSDGEWVRFSDLQALQPKGVDEYEQIGFSRRLNPVGWSRIFAKGSGIGHEAVYIRRMGKGAV